VLKGFPAGHDIDDEGGVGAPENHRLTFATVIEPNRRDLVAHCYFPPRTPSGFLGEPSALLGAPGCPGMQAEGNRLPFLATGLP